MSKRKRDKSPTSENTLIENVILSGSRFVDSESSDDDGDRVVNNELFLIESESEDTEDDDSDVVDDTDEDPDFEPHNLDHISSDEDEQPSTSTGRPRGRPPRPSTSTQSGSRPRRRRSTPANFDGSIYNVFSAIGEEDAVAGWSVVCDENDPGNETDHPFFEQPGPKRCPSHDAKPIEYFYLFFTSTLLQTFVNQTNLYAAQYFERVTDSVAKWQPITLPEMKGFLAVILNMGLYKKPTINSYWRTKSKSQSTPWFREMFSRDRFKMLLRFFHLTDSRSLAKPGEPNYDPCGRFSMLVDHANRVFRSHYTPHRELSVDESLVGTKSHTAITQYLPNKHHHRWGIKLWMICDSVTNYCLGFYCYKGKKGDALQSNEDKKLGSAYGVVVKLLEMGQYLNKGYHVFVDNFFMSIPLAKFLFSKETYITGTIRRDRKGLPNKMKEKLGVGQQAYLRNKNMVMLSFRQKKSQTKPVLLLSTKYKANTVELLKKRKNGDVRVKKPDVINKYNMYMGGIDTSDQMLYCYLDERRTVKYWRKVAFNIISRMLLNTYIIYKENNAGNILSRYNYTSDIIDSLAEEWQAAQTRIVRPMGGGGDAGHGFGIENLPGRAEKNCSVCSAVSTAAGGPRKRSRYCCKNCKRGIHPLCFGDHRC